MSDFSIPPTTFSKQIEILKSRNMKFRDKDRAEKYLSYIGYHRLFIYWNKFYIDKNDKEKGFIPNLYFEDVLDLYIFDRKLRNLFSEASERIEICLKTLFANYTTLKTRDSLCYTKPFNFKDLDSFVLIISHIKKSLNKKSLDLNTHFWDVMQNITFGTFSKMVFNFKRSKAARFYNAFELKKSIFDNWLNCMVDVRNITAHYGYFYDRSFSTKPIKLSQSEDRPMTIDFEENKENKFYAQFCVFTYFMRKISPTSSWANRVIDLIEEYKGNPHINYSTVLGFPENWKETDLFKDIVK